MMDLWMTEWQTQHLGMSARIKETLFSGRSSFQEIAVVESEPFGRMLVLDGVFQTSLFDEFIYHEMMAHVSLSTHPRPERILIIGGGDGGTAREVLRHPSVKKVEMIEIDGMVVDVCKKFLPEISAALIAGSPRLEVKIGDGIQHMSQAENEYDVIIVDCSDPIGPGEGLFTKSFYRDVYRALKEDGLFVQQTESPFYHQDLIQRLWLDVEELFPVARMYLAHIPLYPGGMHSFTMGSKKADPLKTDLRPLPFRTRYFNESIYRSCFALPNFVQELLTAKTK